MVCADSLRAFKVSEKPFSNAQPCGPHRLRRLLLQEVSRTWQSSTSSSGVLEHMKMVSTLWLKSACWGLIPNGINSVQLPPDLSKERSLTIPCSGCRSRAAVPCSASARCCSVLCLPRVGNWLRSSGCCSRAILSGRASAHDAIPAGMGKHGEERSV